MILTALLTTILPALLPAATDGIKSLIGKISGKPESVDDRIKLMTADTKRLEALAGLDKVQGNISGWVANLRASFRYILATLVIVSMLGVAIYAIIYVPDSRTNIISQMFDLGRSAFFFAFGDRVYKHLKESL